MIKATVETIALSMMDKTTANNQLKCNVYNNQLDIGRKETI